MRRLRNFATIHSKFASATSASKTRPDTSATQKEIFVPPQLGLLNDPDRTESTQSILIDLKGPIMKIGCFTKSRSCKLAVSKRNDLCPAEFSRKSFTYSFSSIPTPRMIHYTLMKSPWHPPCGTSFKVLFSKSLLVTISTCVQKTERCFTFFLEHLIFFGLHFSFSPCLLCRVICGDLFLRAAPSLGCRIESGLEGRVQLHLV